MSANIGKTGIRVDLDDLLDWITSNTYDATYIGQLTGQPEFVVDSTPLLTHLRKAAGLTENQMHDAFDWARIRVHGPNVKGGR